MKLDLSKRINLKSLIIKGIYFLIRNGKIVYIGQSENLINRIMTHYANNSMKFDTVRFIEFDGHKYDRMRYETRLILYFRPKWNGTSESKRSMAKQRRREYYLDKISKKLSINGG